MSTEDRTMTMPLRDMGDEQVLIGDTVLAKGDRLELQSGEYLYDDSWLTPAPIEVRVTWVGGYVILPGDKDDGAATEYVLIEGVQELEDGRIRLRTLLVNVGRFLDPADAPAADTRTAEPAEPTVSPPGVGRSDQ